MPQIDRTDAITRYLLGDASDEQRDWAEAQMLVDEEFLEQCLEIEDQLIDDYVLGHLDERKKKLFEQKFGASPRIQAKLKLVHALVAEVRQTPDRQPEPVKSQNPGSWFGFTRLWSPQWAPATAFILVIAVLMGLGFWTSHAYRTAEHLRDQLSTAQQEEKKLEQLLTDQTQQQAQVKEQLNRERALSAELQDELAKNSATSPAVVALTLFPGGLRTAEASENRVIITPQTKSLRLELLIEPGVKYQQYQVQLEQGDGQPVLTQTDLRWSAKKTAAGQLLTVNLPAKNIADGNYILILEARDDSSTAYSPLGTYNFQLTNRQSDQKH